jgi:hypothetical protein
MHTNIVVTRALALLLFVAVGSACGQTSPGDVPAAPPPATVNGLSSLPLVTPAIEDLARRPGLQTAAWDLRKDFRQARIESQRRQTLEETIRVIQKLASDHKQDLAVVLMNQKHITGRVLAASTSEFKIRARLNHQETTIRYDQIAEWRVVPAAGAQAAQTTVLVLLTIPLFPLFFLAGLAGWDGC